MTITHPPSVNISATNEYIHQPVGDVRHVRDMGETIAAAGIPVQSRTAVDSGTVRGMARLSACVLAAPGDARPRRGFQR